MRKSMQTDKRISQGWPNQTNEQLDIAILSWFYGIAIAKELLIVPPVLQTSLQNLVPAESTLFLCLNTPLPWQDDIPNGKFQLPFLSSIFVDSFYGISYRPGNKTLCCFLFSFSAKVWLGPLS